jgi:hypothetical protein
MSVATEEYPFALPRLNCNLRHRLVFFLNNKIYPMKSIYTLLVVFLSTIVITTAHANIFDAADSSAIEGRWDLTINMNGKDNPSWLEVRHSGFHTWVGHFVGVSGSARPISKINIAGNKFSFAIPPQWEQGNGDMTFEGTIAPENLSGSVVFPDGKNYSWTAVRAPSLRTQTQVTWGKPISLIQNSGLKGWHALGENQWVVEQGILRSPKSGANLVTDATFKDFKLHVEFRYPKGSNSGVYLRGRYEVQVADSKGKEPLPGELGGVYGFIAPIEQVAKDAGEWQTYDITFVGRLITLVANGKTIISNQEIPGITGGALDSKEAEPGPLLLQGDHGPVEYRNIVITPAK